MKTGINSKSQFDGLRVEGGAHVFLQFFFRRLLKRFAVKLNALEKSLALLLILHQLFTEVGAHSDGPFAGVIHHLQTFDDVSNFIVGIVIGPFSYRFLEKGWRNLDQLRRKKCQKLSSERLSEFHSDEPIISPRISNSP